MSWATDPATERLKCDLATEKFLSYGLRSQNAWLLTEVKRLRAEVARLETLANMELPVPVRGPLDVDAEDRSVKGRQVA